LQVATALDMLQVLDSHLDTVRRRLPDAAAHLTGAKVLAARLYGAGPIPAPALTCCLGGGFSSARKAVRFAGLDVTVYSSAGERPPSISDPVRGQPPGTAEAYPVACWSDDKIVEFLGRRSGLAVHLR
jgi:Transposase IS116/IS110/IS902 family